MTSQAKNRSNQKSKNHNPSKRERAIAQDLLATKIAQHIHDSNQYKGEKGEAAYLDASCEVLNCLDQYQDKTLRLALAKASESSTDDHEDLIFLIQDNAATRTFYDDNKKPFETRIFAVPIIGLTGPDHKANSKISDADLQSITFEFKKSGLFGAEASVFLFPKLYTYGNLYQAWSSTYNLHTIMLDFVNGKPVLDYMFRGEHGIKKDKDPTISLRYLVGAVLDREPDFPQDLIDDLDDSKKGRSAQKLMEANMANFVKKSSLVLKPYFHSAADPVTQPPSSFYDGISVGTHSYMLSIIRTIIDSAKSAGLKIDENLSLVIDSGITPGTLRLSLVLNKLEYLISIGLPVAEPFSFNVDIMVEVAKNYSAKIGLGDLIEVA